MSQPKLTKKRPMKGKGVILTFVIIALGVALLRLVDSVYCNICYYLYITYFLSGCTFFIACLFFFLYVIKGYGAFRQSSFVSVAFFALAAIHYITILDRFENYSKFYGDSFLLYCISYNWFEFLIHILLSVPLIFAGISALKGFSGKVWLIIAAVTEILMQGHTIYRNIFPHIHWFALIVCVGKILFVLALLIFGLKNTVPPLISKNKMKPSKRLQMLKEAFECGRISEAEYGEMRMEILRNL